MVRDDEKVCGERSTGKHHFRSAVHLEEDVNVDINEQTAPFLRGKVQERY